MMLDASDATAARRCAGRRAGSYSRLGRSHRQPYAPRRVPGGSISSLLPFSRRGAGEPQGLQDGSFHLHFPLLCTEASGAE